MDGLEKRGRAGAAAPVMRDLQQIGVMKSGDELAFGFALDVAGHQRREMAGADANDDGAVVLGSATKVVRRDAQQDRHRADPVAIAVAHESHRHVSIECRVEEVARTRRAELTRRNPDFGDAQSPDYRRKTAAVVRMDVREHDRIDGLNAAVDEHRQQSRFAEARGVGAPAAVDQERVGAVARNDGVTLPDVEERDLGNAG